MRRLIPLWALMMCLLIPGAAAEDARYALPAGQEGVVLQSAPEAGAENVAFCPAGEWLRVVREEDGWAFAADPEGREGYLPLSGLSEPRTDPVSAGTVTGMEDGTVLNLREQPDYQARVLGVYANGTPCRVLSRQDGWAQVEVDGQTGYFREEFLEEKELPWGPAATVCTASGTGTYLAAGPGASQPRLLFLPEGTYLRVLGAGTTWSLVGADARTGFVRTADFTPGILPPPSSPQPGDTPFAIVHNPKSTQVLNLRENPDTSSRSLAQFANGTRVTVRQQGLEWCEVLTAHGQRGYMMTDFLRLYHLPEVPEKQVSHPDGSYVNFRALPSVTLGLVLAEIPHGSRVTVLAPGAIWYKVMYEGQTGYVAAEFLK